MKKEKKVLPKKIVKMKVMATYELETEIEVEMRHPDDDLAIRKAKRFLKDIEEVGFPQQFYLRAGDAIQWKANFIKKGRVMPVSVTDTSVDDFNGDNITLQNVVDEMDTGETTED
jgi:hypothetical protein